MPEDWIWHQYDYTGVAKFINPDVKNANELYIEENPFDLINENHEDLTPVIKLLYDKLKEQGIRYNNEKGMTDDNQAQSIRKPNEILNGSKEGTCLDLTLLFCGLCRGHRLLPIFVLLEKHALVAVSNKLTYSDKISLQRPLKQLLENGAVINNNNDNALDNLLTLVEQKGYILIECTGFAHTETIPNNFPEGEGRVDGFLDFESAVKAGHKQLNRRKLKMFIDVEIAHRLLKIKPLPLQPNLVGNTNHLSSERVANAGYRYVRLGDFPKGRWINCGPQTEVIRSLVIDPHNSRILYAGSSTRNQSARVYKSRNNGRFWQLANHGLPNLEEISVLAIHYSTKKIYAGTDKGLFISTNGGNSWVKDEQYLDLKIRCIALSQQDEDLIICGTGKHTIVTSVTSASSAVVSAASQKREVCISSNDLHSGGLHISFGSGESLITIPIQNVNAVVISPKDPNIIYVGTSDDGVYRFNGLMNFKKIPKPKARHIFSLAVSPTDSYKIFAGTENGLHLSLDGGESWQIIPEISKSEVLSIQFSPSNDNQILLVTTFKIFESQDGGASWQVLSHELTHHFNCVVISSPEGTIYTGTGAGGGVYKKEQNQLSWQSCNSGFFNESLSGVSLAVDNNNLIFLGTLYGLFRSLNGGSSWKIILKNHPQLSSIWSLATAPKRSVNSSCAKRSGGLFISTDSGHSWQSHSEVFSDLIYAGSTQGKIYRSTDGGSSWQLVASLKGNEVYSLAVSAENTNIVYAGVIGGGVYKSIDGGDSWNPINTGLDNLKVTSLMLSKDSSLLYAASRHQVYRSRDQGKSWQNCTDGLPNEPIYSMIQSHQVSNLIYVATDGGGVYKSVNGGDSWIPKNNGLLNLAVIALELSPENSSILYAGTHNGVFKSIDGGECWQTFSDGLGQNQTINWLAFSPENKNLLYAATMKGSVYKVLNLPHE